MIKFVLFYYLSLSIKRVYDDAVDALGYDNINFRKEEI